MEPDLVVLVEQFDAADRDAAALVTGLTEEQGRWRPDPSKWSVADCLDHMAMTNGVYLNAMRGPAVKAREAGRVRRGPASPGWIGGWFARSLEPPVKSMKAKARKFVQPRPSVGLADAFTGFQASQDAIRSFIREFRGIDLAFVRFPNPFLPGLRFSLATGLHVLAAHDRRHLWQASQVRELARATRRSAAAQPN